MSIVTFYRGDPKNTPKTTMPAHLGANVLITCNGKLLLEKRRDSDIWGLVGGGVKKTEDGITAIIREIYEETGVRVKPEQLTKVDVYGEPGRVAAYRDGSIWRMVIIVYCMNFDTLPSLHVSSESKELRFFAREEIPQIQIAITHSDIVEDWFINNGEARRAREQSNV